MSRAKGLAGVLDTFGADYLATRELTGIQAKAWRAILACRTPALGGHVETCDACGTSRHLYHSCRNRHCPTCQTRAKEVWLSERHRELLPTPYFHLVFTLPHALHGLIAAHPKRLYETLFQAASATLTAFAADPKHLGGQSAFTLVLHTWKQDLGRHVHVHALVAGGALTATGEWVHPQNAAVARSGRQVIDQGEVALPLGAGDFIDTKVTNPGQGLRPGNRDRLGQVGTFDGFHRVPRQARVTRHRGDRHVPGHAGNQAGVAFRHARLGRHEGQLLDTHVAGRQEGLGILDLDFAGVPAQRHVQHRPPQQAIDRPAPSRAVIYRPTAPVTVADDPHPPALFVEHNVLDHLPLKPQNLRRDDRAHNDVPTRVVENPRGYTIFGCRSSHFSVGFTGRALS